MPFNGYVAFGDIKGESTDKDHKDWIALEGFSSKEGQQGISLELTLDGGVGGLLTQGIRKGVHLPEVTIDLAAHQNFKTSIHSLYSRHRFWGVVVADVNSTPAHDTITLEAAGGQGWRHK
jgi:hypothetical protein